LEEENSNAIQETESLNKAKKGLESQIEKLKDEQKRNMEAEALKAEHDNMRHIESELEEKLSNAVRKRDCLLKDKACLMSEMEELTAKNKMLLQELDRSKAIRTGCDYLKCKLTELVEENRNAVQESEDLNEDKRGLESQIKELKDEHERLHKNHKEISKLKSEYLDTVGMLKCTHQNNTNLKEVIVSMASHIQELKDEQEMLCEENMKATALKIYCDNIKLAMPELVERLRCAGQERDSLQDAKLRMMSEIKVLKAEQGRLYEREEETMALRTEYNYMKHTMTNLQQELNHAVHQKVSLTEVMTWLMSKNEEIKEELKILHEKDKEANALRTACDDTKQSVTKLNQDLNVVNKEIRYLEETKWQLASKFKELFNKKRTGKLP
jgi:chromosome segregation ATPase